MRSIVTSSIRPFAFAVLTVLATTLPTSLQAQPAVLAVTAPGTLESADPVVDTPGGMQAWRVAYWTTNQDGRAQRVTGMVVAPREAIPGQPRRVIAWTHGTSGVVEKCAPSLSPIFYTATPALAEMVRRGYVVVAPDYPGLGSAMPHPYLIGGDTARSVLDAVRAARQIPGAASGSSFAVWGESQGGHAALWTAAEARRYAPDLTLTATAAAAPPTDLPQNLLGGTDANVRAMLTAFTAYSWSERFGAPLSTLFNRANQGVAQRLARNNCITLGASPRLGTILGVAAMRNALKGKDMGTIAPWAGIARRNSVIPANVPGPLLLAQSVNDPIVSPAVTRAFARQRCRTGRPLRWVSLPGGDHAHSARDSATVTLDWIDARFAGTRAPSDCGRL